MTLPKNSGNGEERKPAKTFSYLVYPDTYVQAAVWPKTVEKKDGGTFLTYEVSVRKRYRDTQSREWKTMHSFRGSELYALAHAVNHAAFKSLLFLGAGAVLHATGTRSLEALGGLVRRIGNQQALLVKLPDQLLHVVDAERPIGKPLIQQSLNLPHIDRVAKRFERLELGFEQAEILEADWILDNPTTLPLKKALLRD